MLASNFVKWKTVPVKESSDSNADIRNLNVTATRKQLVTEICPLFFPL